MKFGSLRIYTYNDDDERILVDHHKNVDIRYYKNGVRHSKVNPITDSEAFIRAVSRIDDRNNCIALHNDEVVAVLYVWDDYPMEILGDTIVINGSASWEDPFTFYDWVFSEHQPEAREKAMIR